MSESILDRFRLNDKCAIVTGASRGLGAAMALALAEAGADLVLVARSDTALLQKSITALGRKCITIAADVGDPASAESIVAAAYATFGRADILVNNAGIIRRAPVLEFSTEDWNDVMRTNLDGVFLLSQKFAAEIVTRQRAGKIINIASMLSFQGGVRVVSYTASKSALAGLTRALANELAASGLNINAIAPGYMATDNTAALQADPVRNKSILDRIPAARWGAATDLAGAVVFLASPASDYIHGITLPVDGGWLAR